MGNVNITPSGQKNGLEQDRDCPAPVRMQVFLFKAPCLSPVMTSFGVMHARTSLLVRLEDAAGCFGWGKIWCNFPESGGLHRASLLTENIAPLLWGQHSESLCDFSATLANRLAVLTIQSGEYGPFAQALAGIDCALWDMAARKAGLYIDSAIFLSSCFRSRNLLRKKPRRPSWVLSRHPG
ncbi:MAG: hypothetical protein LBN33_06895 [Desulfovibrio sp.]|jgi:L-alanine-DL-glutamate epimerase-like enolase superfamily enzyme|nr:hypothetical protein [Desulfovibrio sp.]